MVHLRMKQLTPSQSVPQPGGMIHIRSIHSLLYTVCPVKSVTLTISENIPKPQNKCWNFFNCTDTLNPWPKHM